MTVLENIGLYHDVLTDDALDRVTASIDEWLQVLDDGGGELMQASLNQSKSAERERAKSPRRKSSQTC